MSMSMISMSMTVARTREEAASALPDAPIVDEPRLVPMRAVRQRIARVIGRIVIGVPDDGRVRRAHRAQG